MTTSSFTVCIFLDPDSQTAPADRCCFGILVSGHGSQVPAPPEDVEETDGVDEGQRAAHVHSSKVSDIPWTAIWPCDIQASLDTEEMVQIEGYILDDVSIPPPTSFPNPNSLAL